MIQKITFLHLIIKLDYDKLVLMNTFEHKLKGAILKFIKCRLQNGAFTCVKTT